MSNIDAFADIVRIHRVRYPLMQPQDFGKLAYQSEFGPAHFVTDEAAVIRFLLDEWQTVSAADIPCNPEPIGGGYCRFHLTADTDPAVAAPVLAKLFMQSAAGHAGTPDGLDARLEILRTLPVEGMDTWLQTYRGRGCPPVRHSETFRNAYHPHYRVVLESLADRIAGLR